MSRNEYFKEYNKINSSKQKIYRENNKEHLQNYRDDNKEHKQAYDKLYREKNKERILEKKIEYKENNKEHIKEQSKDNYEKTKLNHPEKIKEYSIVRNLHKKTLITCECGSIISYGHKWDHIKTKKHIKLLNEAKVHT
jgi:hypothetical protein